MPPAASAALYIRKTRAGDSHLTAISKNPLERVLWTLLNFLLGLRRLYMKGMFVPEILLNLIMTCYSNSHIAL
ncbi:hypothetical protein D0S45_15800 [Marinifilum sp. JC120]|nr:hypothetical protein D0S45_15800 [Marinifilum sp. JC120]